METTTRLQADFALIGSAGFPKISHLKKRAFLAAFSRCGSLSKAAKRATVDRRTHYNWLKDDPWYVEAFRQAVIEAGDSLQDRLTEMAFDGNVTAAIFLLKGLKPEKFRDRMEQTNLLEIDPRNWTDAQVEIIAEALLKKAAAGDPQKAEALRRQAQIEAGVQVVDAECQVVEARST
jgi:hypothetical protein